MEGSRPVSPHACSPSDPHSLPQPFLLPVTLASSSELLCLAVGQRQALSPCLYWAWNLPSHPWEGLGGGSGCGASDLRVLGEPACITCLLWAAALLGKLTITPLPTQAPQCIEEKGSNLFSSPIQTIPEHIL